MNLSEKVGIESFFQQQAKLPIMDVRSPGEFEHAHIPGSYNLPLFDNNERAVVGTIYKNSGNEDAVLKGLEIVGPKMVNLVKEAKKIASGNETFIHCWRGGMRSESMAWLLEMSGIKCFIVEGGYKADRRYIKRELAKPASFLILGGMTGSGKTRILKALKELGEQIIDIEQLANHRGSSFGGIGQESQPSTEQFENDLYSKWRNLDRNRTIWLEDESKSIGKVKIPDEIFLRMRQSPVIQLLVEKEIRVQALLSEYAKLDTEELKNAILRIQKKLGGLDAIDNEDFTLAIEYSLNYYDRAYLKGLGTRQTKSLYPLELESTEPLTNARKILAFVSSSKLVHD